MLAAAFCAALSSAVCAAQSYTNWQIVASNSVPGLYAGNTYAVDVNNDGITDLITDEYVSDASQQPYFAVFIAKGDGTFYAPARYQYSSASIPPGNTGPGAVPFAFGDFNGDGNIDVAMPVGNHTIAVYLGKGDGTFLDPWYSVIDLPSNQYILTAYPTIVATDFNHDGKVDLTVVGVNTDSSGMTAYVLPGQGNGLFSTVDPIMNFTNPEVGGDWGILQMLTGDFDGDTNADLMVKTATGDREGGLGMETFHALYGDGNFGFGDTIFSTSSFASLIVGDLNSDGKSDLFGLGNGLQTWYGQGNRTFASYTQALPAANYIFSSQPMADLNNDGMNDLVANVSSDSQTPYLVFLLATPTPGQFDVQTWNVPAYVAAPVAGSGVSAQPVVGNFRTGDQKPDFAYIGFTGAQSYSINTSIPYTGLNATVGQLWSNCDYPNVGRGINLCSPAIQSGTSVNFNATAHSFGDLRKIELWVDGTKLDEQYNTWGSDGFFNFSSAVAAGTHQGTYYAADMDNTLQRYDFQFTVPSSCAAPTSEGVNICAPANGSTINSNSALVQAAANITGTLARMEIWVDSTKVYTETNSTTLSAAETMSPGAHQITVFAVNTDGTVWSQAVSATIQ
jgi:hypothetical protein